MKQQKKNKFFTFMFSFIPGAAEMYMGFMKQGISLMTLFMVCLGVPLGLHVVDLQFLALSAVVVWFYSFFHARNLAACSEEEFRALTDEYVWSSFIEGKEIKITNPTLRKWGAIVLIVYGASRLWDSFLVCINNLFPSHLFGYGSIFHEIPRIVVSLVIIIIGLKLIAGKKEELNGDGE